MRSIKDMWPNLFGQRQVPKSDEEPADEGADQYKQILAQQIIPEEQSIEEQFKNLRWSRVIAVIDFREDLECTYEMAADI